MNFQKTRIMLLLPLLLMTLLSFSGCEKDSAICKDCNIILISVDTLRADSLGSYGNTRNVSPSIDKFASNALLFENAFSQASSTAPSHMSTFTSTYPHEHGICNVPDDCPGNLSKNTPTLAEVLRAGGYYTLAITDGGMIYGNRGFERGFNQYYNQNAYFDIHGIANQTLDLFADFEKQVGGNKFFIFIHTYSVHEPYRPTKQALQAICGNYSDLPVSSDNELTRAVIKQVKTNPDSNISKEFYQIMGDIEYKNQQTNQTYKKIISTLKIGDNSYSDISPVLEFIEKSMDMNEYPLLYSDEFHYSELSRTYENNFVYEKNAATAEKLKCIYEAQIYDLDYKFQDFFNSLVKYNQLNNTIVIITSDHGEEFYEHGSYKHRRSYTETIHVPLIIYLPKSQVNGRIQQNVRLIDLFPTILELVGIENNAPIRGTSLVPILNGQDLNVDVFTEDVGQGEYSLISKEYAIVQVHSDRTYLFNTKTDFIEQKDLDANETHDKYGNVFERLSKTAAHYLALSKDSANKKNNQTYASSLDSEQLQQLTALGYI